MTRFFSRLSLSFYSPEFYARLARDGAAGIGGFYLGALTLLTTLVLFVAVMTNDELRGNMEDLPAAIRQLPQMTIKDGQLSADGANPHVITVGTMGRVVIDTSRQLSDLSTLKEKMANENIVAMIVRDGSIVSGENRDEIRVTDFKKTGDQTVTRQQIESAAQGVEKGARPLLAVILLTAAPFGLFIYYLIMGFIASLCIAVAALPLRVSLDFGARMRLASAARVPVEVITILPLGPWAALGIWAAYLIFAVWSCRLNREEISS